jgi:hypothetical protein
MLKQLKLFYYFYETEITNTSDKLINYTREEDLSDYK